VLAPVKRRPLSTIISSAVSRHFGLRLVQVGVCISTRCRTRGRNARFPATYPPQSDKSHALTRGSRRQRRQSKQPARESGVANGAEGHGPAEPKSRTVNRPAPSESLTVPQSSASPSGPLGDVTNSVGELTPASGAGRQITWPSSVLTSISPERLR
jgi:hypothetical protein